MHGSTLKKKFDFIETVQLELGIPWTPNAVATYYTQLCSNYTAIFYEYVPAADSTVHSELSEKNRCPQVVPQSSRLQILLGVQSCKTFDCVEKHNVITPECYVYSAATIQYYCSEVKSRIQP